MYLPSLFESFTKERQFLRGVTPATLRWYACSWQAFEPHLPSSTADLSGARLKAAMVSIAANGLRPVTVNTYTRCINAFLAWMHAEGHTPERLKIAKLKEPDLKPRTLRPEHIRCIVRWTPRTHAATRLQVLLMLLLDCGLRISETLALERSAIDFEQSTLTVLGKGRKQRTVPVSKEMRRRLWVWLKSHQHELVFATRDGRALSNRNVQHAMRRARKALALPEGQRFSPHVLRHTFATGYLRRGGDPFRLQRILGHSTLAMTLRYCSLEVGDLCAVHDRYSPLAS